jgi:hypothetical protein
MLIEKTYPRARRLVVAQYRLAAHRVGTSSGELTWPP